MSRYTEEHDLYFTLDGDFFVSDETEDLEDTSKHQFRGLIQRVLTRLQSVRGEWATQPEVGANLSDFVGLPNTRAVAEELKSRVYSELINDNLISPQHVFVDVYPLSKHVVSLAIVINTPNIVKSVYLNFTYDLRNNRMIPRNI